VLLALSLAAAFLMATFVATILMTTDALCSCVGAANHQTNR